MKQNILKISLILNFLMISIIYFILYNNKQENNNFNIKFEPNNIKKQQQQQSKHVFFDLGANVGDSAENFLGVLDKAISENDIKKVVPANKLKENWIMYLIEGNSKFDQSLLDLKNKYSNKQHEIIVYNGTIVTTYDGEIDFYLDEYSNKTWGSSILENHPDVSVKKIKRTKPCIDLARLLKQYDKDDFLVVKMDIEGAEFELLVHLIKENVLGLIDILAVEYHNFLSPFKSEYGLFSTIFKKYNIIEKNWI